MRKPLVHFPPHGCCRPPESPSRFRCSRRCRTRCARAGADAPPQRILPLPRPDLRVRRAGRMPSSRPSVAPWSAHATRATKSPSRTTPTCGRSSTRSIQSKTTVLTGITERVMVGTHDSPVKAVANTYPVRDATGRLRRAHRDARTRAASSGRRRSRIRTTEPRRIRSRRCTSVGIRRFRR